MSRTIRKAVIPAAGLGTRWLPATKCVAKELLPVAGKPLIQHAVEEAVASGLEEIVVVSAPGKHDLEHYFQPDPLLERQVAARGNGRALQEWRRLRERFELRVVIQEQPLGLAHAIACTQPLVGDEPFAVLLPDNLIFAAKPCTLQLIECHSRLPGCMVAIRDLAGRPRDCGTVVPGDRARGPDKLFAV
ncbi:MAG TPA: sugar phosphate nucleotidyltransferase, partial [Terriglobales bacterium]|nr:sugar phosphate nucleotidyltransferase [Terriglobales bacterium]